MILWRFYEIIFCQMDLGHFFPSNIFCRLLCGCPFIWPPFPVSIIIRSQKSSHDFISSFYFHKKIFGTDRVLKDIIYKWSIIFIINVWCPKSVAKKKCVHSNWVQHILYVSNSIYRSMVIFTRFVLWELRIFLMENF